MNQPVRRDPPPFMFAVESVIGLMAQGKSVNEANVRQWLEVALNGNEERIRPALYHARRMLQGPAPEGVDPAAAANAAQAAPAE